METSTSFLNNNNPDKAPGTCRLLKELLERETGGSFKGRPRAPLKESGVPVGLI